MSWLSFGLTAWVGADPWAELLGILVIASCYSNKSSSAPTDLESKMSASTVRVVQSCKDPSITARCSVIRMEHTDFALHTTLLIGATCAGCMDWLYGAAVHRAECHHFASLWSFHWSTALGSLNTSNGPLCGPSCPVQIYQICIWIGKPKHSTHCERIKSGPAGRL